MNFKGEINLMNSIRNGSQERQIPTKEKVDILVEDKKIKVTSEDWGSTDIFELVNGKYLCGTKTLNIDLITKKFHIITVDAQKTITQFGDFK